VTLLPTKQWVMERAEAEHVTPSAIYMRLLRCPNKYWPGIQIVRAGNRNRLIAWDNTQPTPTSRTIESILQSLSKRVDRLEDKLNRKGPPSGEQNRLTRCCR
jgi:hypothetical protein